MFNKIKNKLIDKLSDILLIIFFIGMLSIGLWMVTLNANFLIVTFVVYSIIFIATQLD